MMLCTCLGRLPVVRVQGLGEHLSRPTSCQGKPGSVEEIFSVPARTCCTSQVYINLGKAMKGGRPCWLDVASNW